MRGYMCVRMFCSYVYRSEGAPSEEREEQGADTCSWAVFLFVFLFIFLLFFKLALDVDDVDQAFDFGCALAVLCLLSLRKILWRLESEETGRDISDWP